MSSPLKRIVTVQFLSQTQAPPKPQLSVPKTEVFGKRSHRAGSLPAGHAPRLFGAAPLKVSGRAAPWAWVSDVPGSLCRSDGKTKGTKPALCRRSHKLG